MAPYPYNWSRSHFQALPIMNTKPFYGSQKEYGTQKVARVNGSWKTKGKGQERNLERQSPKKSKFLLIRGTRLKHSTFLSLILKKSIWQVINLFMPQSTHKMANLTQNEICAVLCSKRPYKQHDGEKVAMWNFAHSRYIKLWKSITNTIEKFIKHVLPAKVRAINRLANTNHRTRKRQEGEEEGWVKRFVCQRDQERDIHYTAINKYDIN